MNGLGLHVQHRLGTCGRQATRLLNDEGHRIALVQEPELQRKGRAGCKLPQISSPALKLDAEFPPLDFCLVSAVGSSPSAEGAARDLVPREGCWVHQLLSRAWAFAGTAAQQLPDL